MRKGFTEIPSEGEMQVIFDYEEPRDIPSGKESPHFASVEPFRDFLITIGYPGGFLEGATSWQEALNNRTVEIDQIVQFILSQDPQRITVPAKKVYQYLSEEDEVQKADIIFAFGARTNTRVEKAVELFKAGLAPKILFSGKTAVWDERQESEAQRYKEYALSQDVPESVIILEEQAITIPDNVRRSLNLLDQLGLSYGRILLVNSPYVGRRAFAHLQKYTPEGTEIYRVNCETREGLRENDWFTNEEGIKYVVNEFGKIWISLQTNTI